MQTLIKFMLCIFITNGFNFNIDIVNVIVYLILMLMFSDLEASRLANTVLQATVASDMCTLLT